MWYFLTIVLSVLSGILLTLLVQWYIIRRLFFNSSDFNQPPHGPTIGRKSFQLPEDFTKLLEDYEKKEKDTCVALNVMFQFLFKELKDTIRVRRWFMKKLSVEFEELLQKTTTGKLLEQVTVRDLNLGNEFPVVKLFEIKNVTLHDSQNHIEELDITVDLDYKGGFQLSVDADLVLGRSASLSVKVTRLKGQARFQLTRQPFSHWSFSFYEEPVMEFKVESQFQGRPLPQVTSLIINQIRRTIRKKHTLPNYKIRFKPFFLKPEPPSTDEVYVLGNKITEGIIDVTVIECSRLYKCASNTESVVYCSLAIDSNAWVELVLCRNSSYVTRDIDIPRQPGQYIGLTFKQGDDDSITSNTSSGGNDDNDEGLQMKRDSRFTEEGRVSPSSNKSSPASGSPIRKPTLPWKGIQNTKLRVKGPNSDNTARRASDVKDLATEFPQIVDSDNSSYSGVSLKRTSLVKFNQDPIWEESFVFEVEEHHQFLNVCVWSRNLDKTDKQDRTPKSEKDVLHGHVSVPLVDIAMACATNSQSSLCQTFNLLPPEPKATASRTHKLSSHPGFDENLCYGDISLQFVYKPQPLNKKLSDASTRECVPDSEEENASTTVEDQSYQNELDYQHDFIVTQFHTTIWCNFCGKKIWLKMAFQCRSCALICHKKCAVKCQAGTKCKRDASDKSTAVQSEKIESDQNQPVVQGPEIITTDTGQEDIDQVKNNHVNYNKGEEEELEDFENPSELSVLESPSASLQGNLFCIGYDSEPEEDMETTIQRLLQCSNDEAIVSAAKEKGKELYANYSLNIRKEKLNLKITRLQTEIDTETTNRNGLSRTERTTIDPAKKACISLLIAKSDEKIQALAILMLYYCSGLQHCQELEEEINRQLK